jgi:hypothetical protein
MTAEEKNERNVCVCVCGFRPSTLSPEELMINLSMLRSTDESNPEGRGGTAGVATAAQNVSSSNNNSSDYDDSDPMLRRALALSMRESGGGGGGRGGGGGGRGGTNNDGEETLAQQLLARTATRAMEEAPPPPARPVPQKVVHGFPWLIVDDAFDWSGYLGAAEIGPAVRMPPT